MRHLVLRVQRDLFISEFKDHPASVERTPQERVVFALRRLISERVRGAIDCLRVGQLHATTLTESGGASA